MSTWKAVYVEEDTLTEVKGWYVVGFSDSISPVVLKVEGSDIDGLREAVATTTARSLNRSERNHATVTVTADTPAIRDAIEKRMTEAMQNRCQVTYLDCEDFKWWRRLDASHSGRHFAHTDTGAASWSAFGQANVLRANP